jgi:hypothetical protein
MSNRTSLRLNDVRERRLDRLKETFDENTNAKALDRASMHALRDRERVDELAEELEDEFQEEADRYVGGLFSLDVEVSVRVE